MPAEQILPPSRMAALASLERILPVGGGSGQDLQAGLDATLRSLSPDPRDKALATELVYGYLRYKGRMEHLAAKHLSKPERTHPLIMRVLGVAIYELLFLDGIPPHATLSWAVNAVKARLGQTQANLANAVLRRIQALGPDAMKREYYVTDANRNTQSLAAWYSLPEWLVKLWMDDYGHKRAEELMQAQLLPPLTGLRVNAAKPDAREFYAKIEGTYEWAAGAFPFFAALPSSLSAADPGLLEAEAQGRLSRQTVSAGYLLAKLGAPAWKGPVWDCCAGRGGKTTALLEAGHEVVWASDSNMRRLRGLDREILRLGLNKPLVFLADASRPPLRSKPGTVLVDAPCSGLGVLSRRPDSKWKRTLADVRNLAKVQRTILEQLSQFLPSGADLVYATCTMTKGENEAQAAFLEKAGWERIGSAEPQPGLPLREAMWGCSFRKR
ncbi:transcription antitermination factor NusB [Fundidesulfovibrio soli]|uniref:transcription antitermination factor NusB n=1 Tax=Fundidesulfovibrio soli TaxID=2922716 RepID=UPI001FAF62EC|nr:transcription antitermination factor NusB [Fundidesulfovibrio soli]